MAADAYVTVHRRDDITKDWVFHGKLSPGEATEEVLATLFGGGTYRCQEKQRDESGAWRIGRTRTVKLTGGYKPPVGHLPGAEPKKDDSTVVAPVAPVQQGVPDIISAGILQLFQAAQAQQQMMTQMFTQSQQAQNTMLQAVLKGGDSKNELTEILKAAVPLVTAYLAQPKQERDPLDMLKAVGEIVRSNQGKQSDSVSDTIAAMRDLLEMKDMLSPGNDRGDPLMDSVPKLVEVLAEEQAARRRASSEPKKPWVAPKVEKIPSGETPVTPLGQPMYVRILRSEGKRLIAAAKDNRDPELVADVALEFAPDAIKPALVEFFGMEDCGDKIVTTLPELVPYREWVNAFVVAAREIIFGEEEGGEPAPEATAETGEEPHVGESEG